MKNIVIVDVDGTLTHVSDRVLCIKSSPPDWNQFYARCGEDDPVLELIELVNRLSLTYKVIICTGRRESCRQITEKWFEQHGLVENLQMLMRIEGDRRQDTIVKPELIANAGIDIREIAFAIEDRITMVQKWREMGIMCLQVDGGKY